jgi:hypothetical protein
MKPDRQISQTAVEIFRRRFSMRKLNVITVLLLVSLFGIFGILNTGVTAKNVRLNIRDLPQQGIRLMGPTDPSFDNELAKLSVGKSEKQKRFIEVTKPFSLFVRNNSPKAVIAYRVRWDSIQPDGTITTHIRTQAEPDVLLGGDAPSRNAVTDNAGVAIRSNSSRYVSVASSVDQFEESGIMSGVGRDSSAISDPSQIQRMGAEKNSAALIELLGLELKNSESLTATLDVVVFEDGSFAGPDSLNYIDQLRALISAKRQLLDSALAAARQNKPLGKVYDNFQTIADEPETSIRADSKSSDYYKFYRQEFAKELLRTRTTTGDDRQATWLATRRLFKHWPKLHPAGTNALR